MEGTSKVYERVGDSGGRVTFHFCGECGATVYWELDGLPAFLAVAVGAFADPSFQAPTMSVYETRRHPWAPLPESLRERFD